MSGRVRAVTALVGLLVLVPQPAPAQDAGADAAGGTVLLDAGAEPRRTLRYAWSEGYRERARATVAIDLAASEAGAPVLSMRLPLTMTILAGVTATGDDGRARIAMLFEDVAFGPLEGRGVDLPEGGSLPPEAAAGLEAAADLLTGARAWQVMDDRGGVLRAGMELPGGVPEELEEQISQASGSIALLPEEAVGIGARWETTGTTVSQGIPVSVTTTVELVAIEGDDVTLAMSMRLADGEDVLPPTVNPFASFTVVGGGTNVVDLAGIFPRELAMDLRMTMAGDLPVDDGTTAPVEMQVVLDMEMAADPVEA